MPSKPNNLLAGIPGASNEELQRLRSQMEQLTNASVQQVFSLKENTGALAQSTAGKSIAETATNTAKNAASSLGFGTMLSPLVTGLMKLFGGGKKAEPLPELTPIQRPASVYLDAATGTRASSSPVSVDYGQNGEPRRAAVPQQNVTIQIQALDSQSLMDRSGDLAHAVRQAMLESSRLNDVISEL